MARELGSRSRNGTFLFPTADPFLIDEISTESGAFQEILSVEIPTNPRLDLLTERNVDAVPLW